jgi:hypothetical protein
MGDSRVEMALLHNSVTDLNNQTLGEYTYYIDRLQHGQMSTPSAVLLAARRQRAPPAACCHSLPRTF